MVKKLCRKIGNMIIRTLKQLAGNYAGDEINLAILMLPYFHRQLPVRPQNESISTINKKIKINVSNKAKETFSHNLN